MLNVRSTLAQGTSARDLPSAITPTGIAFSLFLLTAQVLPQLAAFGHVGIDMPVNRFMAERQLARNLLWAPLQMEQRVGQLQDTRLDLTRIAAVFRARQGQFTGLLGAITRWPLLRPSSRLIVD